MARCLSYNYFANGKVIQKMKRGMIMKILISGADRGLGYGMTELLLQKGHTVYAGQYLESWDSLRELRKEYPNSLYIIPLDVGNSHSVETAKKIIQETTNCLDMIISNAGIFAKTDDNTPMITDYDQMMHLYNINSIGSVRLVENFYNMMNESAIKRFSFISSEAGSITAAKRIDTFSYCMSKAALNMYAKLIYNRLHPTGYSVRLYHPGWVKSYMQGFLSEEGELTIREAAKLAVNYFLSEEVDESNLNLYGYDGEIFDF